MTVAALASSILYLENGVTTAFAAPFRFLSPQFVKAQRISADGVTTQLAYGADYSVTGGSTDAGGTVTVTTPAATGVKLFLYRETVRAQDMDYTTGGTFPAESHEAALDRAMMIDQELAGQQTTLLQRALLVPVGEIAPPVASLADAEGMFLGVEGGRVGPIASPASDLLVQAQAALDAANNALATVAGPLATVTRYAPRVRRWLSPSGMNNPLGVAIDCSGSGYGFSSDPYVANDWTNSASGITHLYVAPVAGLDSNAGTSIGLPWKSLDKVLASAPDKSIVHYIEPYSDFNAAVGGNYDFTTRRIKIVSDVSIGTVFTTWNFAYNLAYLAWVADGSAYKTTSAINGATVQSMIDRKYRDLYGLGLSMQYLTSSALVKSTPGSWWWDNGTGTLWVHMIDNRVPDPANGWTPITSFGGFNFLTDSELVIENCEFGYNGGGGGVGSSLRVRPTTAFVTNDAKVSLRKVKAFGSDGNAIQIMDFDTTVLQQCAGSDSFFDIFNYSSFISTGIQAQDQTVYEDRCHGHSAGSTIGKVVSAPSNSNNLSTGHRGKHIYRVGTNGYGCPNSFIADVQGCFSMNAGIDPTESTKAGGLFLNNYWNQKLGGEGSAGSKMVLIGCSGEALSAGRNVFSNWDDSDTVASLGEIHLADWMGSPSASRKTGTIIKNYDTGATL